MPKDAIKIERGVPLPTQRQYHRGKWKVILEGMKVGDSFKLDAVQAPVLRYSIAQHKRRNKPKKDWVVRKVNMTEWRCWRTK